MSAMKASLSQQSSPATSSSSSVASQGAREHSDTGEHSPPSSRDLGRSASHPPTSTGSDEGGVRGEGVGVSLDEQTVLLVSQPECGSPSYTGLPELTAVRPLILHHPHLVDGVGPPGDENSMSWLYDFYPNVLGTSPKGELYVEQSTGGHHIDQQEQTEFCQDNTTIFRSQEKYVVTLGAPISIAQRMNDHTLTYLNKGQFYTVSVNANTRMSLPQRVKTVLALTFFDESDRRVEFNHWQYWHNLQANPNQRAFDIDRKNCENVLGKLEDLAYNAASFVWTPEVGAKIVLRINCLSTDFSSQKGVKGIPLFLVVDTYEDINSEASPNHRALCRIKIFRDKGAERKNKEETKSVERRVQKFMKEQQGGALESEGNVSSLFHPPSKETVLTSTNALSPKMFLFTPQKQDYAPASLKTERRNASSEFLQNIKERETKRTFSRALMQAKEDLGALEVEVEDTPSKKAKPRIPNHKMTTIYVRKQEESIYNALLLESLSIHEFKQQISKKYNVPPDMIKEVLKKTSRGLLVHFDDDMISHFKDEDDFIIDLTFDNQKGCFNLHIQY